MEGYWWQCEACGYQSKFEEAVGSKNIARYIWDELIPSAWDPKKLSVPCPKCNKGKMRITYEFPRKNNPEIFQVIHIIGLVKENEYVPMMWEIKPLGEDTSCFDFKYIIGPNPFGLNKPAIFTQEELRELFNLYKKITRSRRFP